MQDPTTLSELEGAILSELHHRGRQTAFKVRRSFALSPSLEWRGSAGAVYAAIRRLEKAGLIDSETQDDGRGSRLLFLSKAGTAALMAWACDAMRAVSVGVDPFRLRSGVWLEWPPAKRAVVLDQLRQAILTDIEKLKAHVLHNDNLERTSLGLAIRLQETRLAWLDERRAD